MFQVLNDDLLIQLFEQLRPGKGLRALSSTCRSLREAAIPILFKRCRVKIYTSSLKSRHFPPMSLWPYVRYLRQSSSFSATLSSKDRLVCGVFDGSFLKEALQAMPQLYSVTLTMDYDIDVYGTPINVLHGLCWESFEMFLSLPRLCEFFVNGFSFCPRRFPQSEARAASGSLAPLTSFRFSQDQSRRPPRSYPAEHDVLVFVIETLHSTLEFLELPIESAPLDALSSLSWPRLRELRLSGEYPDVGLPASLVSVVSNMPKLRVLALHFALPNGMSRPLLLPRGSSIPFACNELTDLSISFPDPHDAIYDNLPQTLRRLSLRCCPHHCLQHWDPNHSVPWRWHSPILSASELIHILRRCNTPSLDHFQVEYVADSADPDVLSTMAFAFPVLRSLEMSRFKEPGGNDVSIVRLAPCFVLCANAMANSHRDPCRRSSLDRWRS
ncbi:hypothetical protein LXA43DRAFT_888051 [Ganoderma leucocontextum]|nr:hypothetical protein LXA43DRAFT_888051 [Ganoderma leucocontextum]